MTTAKQFIQPVMSLPPRQLQQPPKISLKTKETLYVLGVLAGTAFTAISQQAAFTSIPLLGLLLMQRASQHRLTLAQQQQQQQLTTVVQQSLNSLSTQIKHLETQIHQQGVGGRVWGVGRGEDGVSWAQPDKTESSPKNYLTKTHLTPIIAKLTQLQHENKVFKFKELGDLTQQINTLQQHLDRLTHQTENLQVSQQPLEQQFQPRSPQLKPSHQSKHTPNQPQKTNRVAIFIDGANIYHSACQLGLEPPDYADFLTFLKSQSSSSKTFFYTGIDSSNLHQRKRLLRLKHLDCQIISKEVIKRADGSCKANLDVELALDL